MVTDLEFVEEIEHELAQQEASPNNIHLAFRHLPDLTGNPIVIETVAYTGEREKKMALIQLACLQADQDF